MFKNTKPPNTLPSLEQLTVVPKANASSFPINHLLITVDLTTDKFSPPNPNIILPVYNQPNTFIKNYLH